jgi:hypothetical protein
MHATPEYFKARKIAVYYQFLLVCAPKEDQCVNVNLINTIMINLCIPRGGFLRVRKILLDCLQSIKLNMEYILLACYENKGAQTYPDMCYRSSNSSIQELFMISCEAVMY